MPSEKITICQGASRSTLRVLITWPRPAMTSSTAAPTAAVALTGTPKGSSAKKPTSSTTSTTHPARKVAVSRIAKRGTFSWATS